MKILFLEELTNQGISPSEIKIALTLNYSGKTFYRQSDLSQAYNDRGFLQYFLRNTKQALEDYTQAIKHQPDYADAYYNRGNVIPN